MPFKEFLKTYVMPKSVGEWIFALFMTATVIAVIVFLVYSYSQSVS